MDAAGNAYITGSTGSDDFPTENPVQATRSNPNSPDTAGIDAFVTKINAAGSALVYSTYLGGNSQDLGLGIAVDADNNAYITGHTVSFDFPTTENAFQPTGGQGFVTKLNPDGSTLLYSTYLAVGTVGQDIIALSEPLGRVYVTGNTTSTDFATPNAFQRQPGGGFDGFVARLDTTKAGRDSLPYATYLGGNGNDFALGIAVDRDGKVYLTGTTESSNFPTRNPFQPALRSSRDAFVAKLHPEAAGEAQLVYSSYLGGNSEDNGRGIAVDAAGNAYVAGETFSTDFPTVKAFQPQRGFDVEDAFVTKVNATGSALLYSTYLGGSSTDQAHDIAIDRAGNAYVTGFTVASCGFFVVGGPLECRADFPSVRPFQDPPPLDPTTGGKQMVFVTKLNAAGDAPIYSSYLGGNDGNNSPGFGGGIAVDAAGNAYVTGRTGSFDFPTVNPLQPTLAGGSDAFVVKISDDGGQPPPDDETPQIVVEPTAVDFGSVKVGRSKTRSLVIRNDGEADLEIVGIDGLAAPFALVSPAFPQAVPPGEELEVTLRFRPTARGTVSQDIAIESNDPDTPAVEVTLTGKGRR